MEMGIGVESLSGLGAIFMHSERCSLCYSEYESEARHDTLYEGIRGLAYEDDVECMQGQTASTRSNIHK